MSGKHGPVPLEKYLHIHDSAMASHLKKGFVLDDGVQFDVLKSHSLYSLSGRIVCASDLVIHVRKTLEVVAREGRVQFVQTVDYTYHAELAKLRHVLRYCAPHEDHNTEHHVHRYDVLGNGKELPESPTFIKDEEKRPTLTEVIEELRGWYEANTEAVAALLASFS